ncbi:hypothetical protein GGR22_000307 [Flavobacterium gossypii]|jgi:Protein of unknown function (DUF1573).|uniref:Uncharacterized protein DUF1573 n=2 Tax=Flavobacterium TaxID=237 RepID=A0A495MIH1_9FLAO|nr:MULTISPECIES: DUF1573 domain-containing protein [Flavobacterium]MBA9072181.1 hypothetical protein [Flavobacterium gossypii]RKS25228.1 uncharacterized protein DUF1573 [Flavobacterium endophyticum]WDO12669.1 DUF1573 domain-containing protein [Flavobacterium sp. WW92]
MIRKTVGLLAIASLVLTVSCKDNASSKVEASNVQETAMREESTGKVPVMSFTEKEFDFGTIKEGDKVEHVFTFTNTGDADLIIADAKGSCGCTVPVFKKEPIKPGETSTMKVTFDSTGKPGKQQKSVNITANTASGNELLTIKAEVTPKAGGIGVTNH